VTGSRKLVTAGTAAAVVLAVLAALFWWANRDSSVTRESATAEVGTGTSGDIFDDDEPEFESSLHLFYNEFLYAGDLHRTADFAALEYGSGLEELATPPVVAEYEAWRAANEAHGDGFQRVSAIRSAPNILGFEVDGAKLTLRDCTAETREMATGQELIHYVTRVVEVANFDGLYRVTAADVQHEGLIDSPGYGCIPDQMGKQASDTVGTVLKEFFAAQANPRSGLPAALDAVVAGKLQTELVSSLAEQTAENLSITSPTDVTLTVLGLDPRGVGLVAVVSACVTFPDGIVLRRLSTGEVLREAFPAGTQHKLEYAIRLNDSGGPAAYAVVSQQLSATC